MPSRLIVVVIVFAAIVTGVMVFIGIERAEQQRNDDKLLRELIEAGDDLKAGAFTALAHRYWINAQRTLRREMGGSGIDPVWNSLNELAAAWAESGNSFGEPYESWAAAHGITTPLPMNDGWGNPFLPVIQDDRLIGIGSCGRNQVWDDGRGDDFVTALHDDDSIQVPQNDGAFDEIMKEYHALRAAAKKRMESNH